MQPGTFSDPNEKQDFRGNFLTNFYGFFSIIMVGWFCFSSYDQWKEIHDVLRSIWMLSGGLLFYLVIGINLFYFRLSADYLEIKSHVYPGFGKKYRLEDISRVSFEDSTGRAPRGMRIKMKTGSRSLNFLAGSLRRRHWEALKQASEARGIPVDDRSGWSGT